MIAESARAVEYVDCISAEGLDPLPTSVLNMILKQSDGETPVMLAQSGSTW